MSRRALVRAAGAAATALAAGRQAMAQGWGSAWQLPAVATYPAHGTWTASPETEISFRGVSAAELGPVRVVGGRSGGHTGVLLAHADGNGVSYLPDAPFQVGEIVTVSAGARLGPTSDGALSFGVARPMPYPNPPASSVTDSPEAPPHQFRSRPDLQPPVMQISTPAEGTADGLVFVTAQVPDGPHGLAILDNLGQPVWYGPPALDTSMQFDFRVQEWRGQPVLTWAEAAMTIGYGFGHYVIADTAYQRIAEFQAANGYAGGDVHEFLLTSRGTALVILYHPVEWDMSSIGGSRYATVVDNIVQELEIETGRMLFEWHSLDHVVIDETYRGAGDDNNRPFDYFHLNSVGETPDGNIVISARHTYAIYKIDRASGEIAWRLNGKRSDFAMGPGTRFGWQHDARLHPNGELSLFDNAEGDQDLQGEASSRGMVLGLNEEAMIASLAREYVHPTGILSTSQGNMQMLPNGNVFVGWGSAPVFSEFGPDGELRFNGRFPRGGGSYRAYRLPWSGQPVDPPDIAVTVVGGTRSIVYASWNGSTAVAAWRAIAGPAPESMEVVGEAERDGFETAIPVEQVADWYAVQALDAAGAVLGTAIAVQPGA